LDKLQPGTFERSAEARFLRMECLDHFRPEDPMPRGSKASYMDKQKRKAQHIEEG
jgi:hypothetical protein